MKIHFVCNGNTFRSRLAEAYLISKDVKGNNVSSSGIEASRNLDGPICRYTEKILLKNDLLKYASKIWTLTTKEILDEQDLIIFMTKKQFLYCTKTLGYNGKNYEIWNIQDVFIPFDFAVETIFNKIKMKVDTLNKYFSNHPSL